MEFDEWVKTVPESITGDILWKLQVYRLALYAADIAWDDITALVRDKRTLSVADQLNRSLGGVSNHIAEGYSRSSGKDRVRLYEYGLGSAREARDWYFKSRQVLGLEVVNQRMKLLTSIIRLLPPCFQTNEAMSYGKNQQCTVNDCTHPFSRITKHAALTVLTHHVSRSTNRTKE